MEAVKQGSACVGLKSSQYALLATLKKSPDELAKHQPKVFKIDNHIGIGIAGLTADARVLCKFMRNQCVNHKYVYDAPKEVERLVNAVADKEQVHTQRYGLRPFGVGLLVIGYDKTGARLFENCPSGNYYDYRAHAIGARSQSARTYLEKHVDAFGGASKDELVKHALLALRDTIQSKDTEGLTAENTTVALVGADANFTVLEGDTIKPYLDTLEGGTMGAANKAVEGIVE